MGSSKQRTHERCYPVFPQPVRIAEVQGPQFIIRCCSATCNPFASVAPLATITRLGWAGFETQPPTDSPTVPKMPESQPEAARLLRSGRDARG